MMRGLFGPEALAKFQAAFEWCVANPTKVGRDMYPGSGARFHQDNGNPAALSRYVDLIAETGLADIVAELFGVDDVWFLGEQVFWKEGESRRTAWHQDTSYGNFQGDELAGFWITFDPVAKEDALEVVRGSHKGPLYTAVRFAPEDDTAPLYDGDVMPQMPDIERERDKWDIISWASEPGDVLVFHPSSLHGGAATHPGRQRRTLSMRFHGPNVRYAPRPRAIGASLVGDIQSRGIELDREGHMKPGDPFRLKELVKVR
jgi:ectoine hydroxylase-related dioxygenase (phytanoyl-CoA dioxygenase family)